MVAPDDTTFSYLEGPPVRSTRQRISGAVERWKQLHSMKMPNST